MKILTFSTLFPNAERPNHGIFVETRLRYLVASGKVESRVVAPVPWFPFKHPRFGKYAAFARVPQEETRFGIKVTHPRYALPPKIGTTIAPMMLYHASKNAIQRIIDEGYDFDLIDAHYFYPDGVAAIMLGKYFNKPVVITARGTDISFIPQHVLPKKMILWAGRHAAAMITVCNALKQAMSMLGRRQSHRPRAMVLISYYFNRSTARRNARHLRIDCNSPCFPSGNLTLRKGRDVISGAAPCCPKQN